MQEGLQGADNPKIRLAGVLGPDCTFGGAADVGSGGLGKSFPMKRSFSLQDLGVNATEPHSDSSTVENTDEASPTSVTGSPPDVLNTMQRSKSMNALQKHDRLPSILALGLPSQNLTQVHGLEILKRGACEIGGGGGMTSLPRSLSNSSLSQLTLQDDDIGAATALMELCGSGKKGASKAVAGGDFIAQEQLMSCEKISGSQQERVVALPSLRELLGDDAPRMRPVISPHDSRAVMSISSMYGSAHTKFVGDDCTAAIRTPYDLSRGGGDGELHAAASRVPAPVFRTAKVGGGGVGLEDAESQDGKHNKYCHFCQHVKVKRATSMLACENSECARRFCEHCLKTHLSNVVPSDGKGISELVDGKWLCPICRKVCCCAIISCDNKHRHCKAYRYRQRRAQQAAKRNSEITNESAGGKLPAPGHFGPTVVDQKQGAHSPLWRGYGGCIQGGYAAAHISAAQAHFVGMEKLQSLHSMQVQNQGVLLPGGGDFLHASMGSVPVKKEGGLVGRHTLAFADGAQGSERPVAVPSFVPVDFVHPDCDLL